jgi:hypothetical protein
MRGPASARFSGGSVKESDGDGNANIRFSKPITFSDFPLPEIVLYCANNTIFLPSEY